MLSADTAGADPPEIGFEGEEEAGTAPEGNGLRWVLDPIDGTATFITGIPLYAILLALVNRPARLAGPNAFPCAVR